MPPNSKERNIKVLVVDDEADIRQMLSDILVGEGFTVTMAENGNRALEAAEKIKPDLVMLDIILPDLDGISVYETMRNSTHGKQIPVIFFSALGEGIPPTFARRTGDAPYTLIPKPVSTSLLLQEVERLLKASR